MKLEIQANTISNHLRLIQNGGVNIKPKDNGNIVQCSSNPLVVHVIIQSPTQNPRHTSILLCQVLCQNPNKKFRLYFMQDVDQ